MNALRWFDEDARSTFEQVGSASLEGLAALDEGEVVSTARTRVTRRVELDGAGYYVKVQDLRGVRLPLRRWPSYLVRGSPLAREARCLTRLRERGFRTPDVVAAGGERGAFLPRLSALVTRELAGWVDLARFLQGRPGPERATATIAAAEALVRRVHEQGLVLLGAKYRNILVPPGGGDDPSELALIDQPDSRPSRSLRLRDKDLRLMARDRARYAPG